MALHNGDTEITHCFRIAAGGPPRNRMIISPMDRQGKEEIGPLIRPAMNRQITSWHSTIYYVCVKGDIRVNKSNCSHFRINIGCGQML